MAADNLTLMAVHAHPDDEASSTGGVLALYSDQGIRTVVVTCTNGEFGDAPARRSDAGSEASLRDARDGKAPLCGAGRRNRAARRRIGGVGRKRAGASFE